MIELEQWDVVEIEWADSTSNDEWQDLESAMKWPDDGCLTVGYYLQHNEATIMVAASCFPNPDDPVVGGTWTIPRAMIKRIRKLRGQKSHADPPDGRLIHADV